MVCLNHRALRVQRPFLAGSMVKIFELRLNGRPSSLEGGNRCREVSGQDPAEQNPSDQILSKVFPIRKTESDSSGQPLRLHRHQEEAVRAARTRANYVLTTGTGSGKSLAYIWNPMDGR
jgi:ATP-dependent helicase YprA (DUF1998 family)